MFEQLLDLEHLQLTSLVFPLKPNQGLLGILSTNHSERAAAVNVFCSITVIFKRDESKYLLSVISPGSFQKGCLTSWIVIWVLAPHFNRAGSLPDPWIHGPGDTSTELFRSQSLPDISLNRSI